MWWATLDGKYKEQTKEASPASTKDNGSDFSPYREHKGNVLSQGKYMTENQERNKTAHYLFKEWPLCVPNYCPHAYPIMSLREGGMEENDRQREGSLCYQLKTFFLFLKKSLCALIGGSNRDLKGPSSTSRK